MLMLIWKNIARRRAQSALTIAITLLTVMAFVMVLGVFTTMRQGLRLSRERLGADAVLLPKFASADGGDLLFTALPENVYMSAEVYEQAKALQGVSALSPQFYAQTLAESCCDSGTELRVVGYDPETDFILNPYLEPNEAGITDEEIIVGANFGSEDVIGTSFLVLGRKFKIANLLKPTGTGTDNILFMNMDVARALCLETPALASYWEKRDPFEHISVVMVKLADGVSPADFEEEVRASGIDARCLLTGDTIASLQGQIDVTVRVLFALWLASLIVAVLALIGRFSALARERRKEIGLLRAIGLQKSRVFLLIIGEASAMALVGGAAGSILALLCMKPVIAALQTAFLLSPSVWSAELALLSGGAGLLLSAILGFAASLVPAVKSASLDPQAAITQGEVN